MKIMENFGNNKTKKENEVDFKNMVVAILSDSFVR